MILRHLATGKILEVYVERYRLGHLRPHVDSTRRETLVVRVRHGRRLTSRWLWRRMPFGRDSGAWELLIYTEDEGRLLTEFSAAVALAPNVEPERRCASCGCHQLAACPGPCRWVGPALCSACVAPIEITTDGADPLIIREEGEAQ